MERVRNIQIIVNLLTWILVLLSTGLFVFRVFTAFPFSNTSRLFDFGWYEYAFNVVWNHMAPSSMYQRSSELRWIHQYLQGTPWHLNGGSQFLYPPQFAVLFSWVAALPIHTANVVWDAILTLCYIGAVTLLVLMIRGDNNNNRSSISLTLLLVAISLSWQPFQTDIYWGNSDSLLFFLVILTFYLKDYRQRPILAGIALGLAVLFKVTPALLLIFFLVKHPRTSISTFVTMTIGTIISWIVVGWKPIIYYVLHLVPWHTEVLSSMETAVLPRGIRQFKEFWNCFVTRAFTGLHLRLLTSYLLSLYSLFWSFLA